MYDLYKTSAFVLGSRTQGESNKVFYLFTREFGMVYAHAQAIRALRSKLNFSTELFSIPRVAIVRGRVVWRLTSAQEEEPLLGIRGDPLKRVVAGRIGVLLRRLCQGESEHVELFDRLRSAFMFLDTTVLDKEQLKHFEIILVLKVLQNLGYMEKNSTKSQKENTLLTTSFSDTWSKKSLDHMKSHSDDAIIAINKSLHESQL